MKRNIALIITGLIVASGVFMTNCSKNTKTRPEENVKRLTNSLALIKKVDSFELEMTLNSKENESVNDFEKTDMKLEDMKKDWKAVVTTDISNKQEVFYLAVANGQAKFYMKDDSGKYSVKSQDLSQLGEMDIMKSIDGYIEFIQKNPDLVSIIDERTYQLNVPKEKLGELYSKISSNQPSDGIGDLTIEFDIGNDSYLQNIKIKESYNSEDVEVNTKYFNYDKKFNIVLPGVSK